MVANWTFNDLSPAGKIAGAVSGNGLTIQRATGTGFVTDTPTLTLVADENSVNGTVVGSVIGTDADREARITALLAADSTLRYNAETGNSTSSFPQEQLGMSHYPMQLRRPCLASTVAWCESKARPRTPICLARSLLARNAVLDRSIGHAHRRTVAMVRRCFGR